MNETMQTIVVAVIIVAAVAWSVRRVLKSNKGGCGCGCGSSCKCGDHGCEGCHQCDVEEKKKM
ncbi:MAG: FeoB-associated Cys-rich membrane protein [Paludibacteraceae bacterium]|nr:FeoB-associated Cys-rich membrane protein [Paludibacteraceae bacterium]